MKNTLALTFLCFILAFGCSQKTTILPDTDVPTTPEVTPPPEEVSTGTPLFIGYTERATVNGGSASNRAVMVSSLQEFTNTFGGATSQSSVHYLYPSIVEFYAHGGKTCYVLSVGDYASPVQKEDLMEAVEISAQSATGADLIVIPDAMAMAAEDGYEVYRSVLNHCSQQRSCVGIFDVYGAGLAGTDPQTAIASFRSNIGEEHLRFGIAYYPWAITENGSLPMAGIMAGIIARTDRTEGIWKTPANKALRPGLLPAATVSTEDQAELAVDAAGGKSINAIRTFTGQGTLVWGGRTLDGNSLDWRYISTVRTSLMIEKDITQLVKAFEFEPNTSNTWTSIKSVVDNYLGDLWRSGALQGTTADKAYGVRVGLGETMTSEDVLQGRLLVQVVVALTRPAEFLTIHVTQQMQE